MKLMHQSGKPVTFWSAVSMGIGAMVGAGIFALLGEAIEIAGNLVYASFILGGIVALFSGYSIGKLGARYPAAGGMIEYLTQAYGVGTFTGTMGILMYFSAIASVTLIAKAFGNYTTAMLGFPQVTLLSNLFCSFIIILFVLINYQGAGKVAKWELWTVGIKFSILVCLALVGILHIQPSLLQLESMVPAGGVFYSLAITFFAYEGFRVITNAAEDMKTPERTLPLSMMVSISLVIILYVAISFAVLGNLPIDQVVDAKDYALARASQPIFGSLGVKLVSITAIISTASAINANLYAVTNVTYQLAKEGELPSHFGKPFGHSREGLIISGIIVILSTWLFDLSSIAIVGSISILMIHAITHLGHLKLIKETGASVVAVLASLVFTLATIVVSTIYVNSHLPSALKILFAMCALAIVIELYMQKKRNREILHRYPDRS